MAKLKIAKKINKKISTIVNSVAQSGADQRKLGSLSTPEMSALARQMGAESVVLLKNEKNILPLSKERVVSVFGRVQKNYFYVGYGSGGDVNATYKISLLEGLRKNESITVNEELASVYEKWIEENSAEDGFWGHWPLHYEEMPVSEKLVAEAAGKSDTALVVIGRSAGEDRESVLKKGSYYLTDDETDLLNKVTAKFQKVAVLLNCGSIMDMSWVERYGEKISAVLYVWQGGMESGNSIADVLSGAVPPCGKLSDTIARQYEDYPSAKNFGGLKFNEYVEDIFVGYRYFETFAKSRVIYPFGFGLSYSDFEITVSQTRISGDEVKVWVNVKNIGDKYSGKEVVQAYIKAPRGMLSKAERSLVAFEKTKLLAPGEEQKLCLSFNLSACASYDDGGYTGYESAYVLEKGAYEIFIGTDVRSATKCRSFEIPATKVTEQCSQICAPDPKTPFERLVVRFDKNGFNKPMTEKAPVMKASLRDRILDNIPKTIPLTADKGYKLIDVKEGRVTMEDFVAQLSFDELEAISRGDYVMGSKLGAPGNAGVMAGVLPSLRDKGIPPITTTDGPSGIRLTDSCSLLPNGVALACSFNKELVYELFCEMAKEMASRGSDILLAPGMNIHRNPLCGRNFEYFSEDPYLTGMIAASYVKGVQSGGLSACPKHFCCNNQETNRIYNDSRVSERALREIYLKGFEICVKTAKPKNIMTSYNKINGVWGHYNYDLCTTVLRNEWGFEGNVMTDWWMRSDESHEFPGVIKQGYRVRAQVNVLMPGGSRTGKTKPDGTLEKSVKAKNGVTFGEMQRNAMATLKMAMLKLK